LPTTSLSLPSLLEGLSYKSRGIFIVLISRKHDERSVQNSCSIMKVKVLTKLN
jgi:hypothetical protein